jgi:hypothetical protein
MPDPTPAFTPEHRKHLEALQLTTPLVTHLIHEEREAITAALAEIDRLRAERNALLIACRVLLAALRRHSEDHNFGEADELAVDVGEDAIARAESRDEPPPPTEPSP